MWTRRTSISERCGQQKVAVNEKFFRVLRMKLVEVAQRIVHVPFINKIHLGTCVWSA